MTHFDLAQRLAGEVAEREGDKHHPAIVWAHELCGLSDVADEVPWCSSFVNLVCWLARLPRSKSARARSWLLVGVEVPETEARPGDIVILKRGGGEQPGPNVISAPGHVGFFAGFTTDLVCVLGGNQRDSVNISRYKRDRILGIRRVHGGINERSDHLA